MAREKVATVMYGGCIATLYGARFACMEAIERFANKLKAAGAKPDLSDIEIERVKDGDYTKLIAYRKEAA